MDQINTITTNKASSILCRPVVRRATIIKPSLHRLSRRRLFPDVNFRTRRSFFLPLRHDRCWRGSTRQTAFLVIAGAHHLIGAQWVRLLPWEWQGFLWPRFGSRPFWIGKLTMSTPRLYDHLCGVIFDPMAPCRRIQALIEMRPERLLLLLRIHLVVILSFDPTTSLSVERLS